MLDPIVIDPPGFNQRDAWLECASYVQKCGGLSNDDGEPNWRAAFGADPGCCACPACRAYHWAWGRVQRCVKCGFEYPVDAWPQYSYGTQDARRLSGDVVCPDPETNIRFLAAVRARLPEKLKHAYYRYGFEHPTADPLEMYHKIDWNSVFPQPDRRDMPK